MPTLKVRGRDGYVTELLVDELLEVDGRPLSAVPDEARLARLEGRVDCLEALLHGALVDAPAPPATDSPETPCAPSS